MILLKSSENFGWPWSAAGESAETAFAHTFPSLHAHLKPHEDALRKRQDQGRFWWELRSCDYYSAFERPKIIHTDIAWRAQFAYTAKPVCLVNTAYVWPASDLYLLAVVNSPLMWAYMWRNAMHGKDEVLRLIYSFTEALPIAQPSDTLRVEMEPMVERLTALTEQDQSTTHEVLAWLAAEFGVTTPGQALEAFADLEEGAFIQQVRARRPKGEPRLSPAAVGELTRVYRQYVPPLRAGAAATRRLEAWLAELVNRAYGLTPEEAALLYRTAPPRMPVNKIVSTSESPP